MEKTQTPHEWLPYLTQRCFDFALALHELLPQAQFVAIGDPKFPDHVGLRVDADYFDVRGQLSEAAFLDGIRGNPQPEDIQVVELDDVAFHCGLSGCAEPFPGLPRKMARARLREMKNSDPKISSALTSNTSTSHALNSSRTKHPGVVMDYEDVNPIAHSGMNILKTKVTRLQDDVKTPARRMHPS